MNFPECPIWILECRGTPTCCCFSTSQSFVIAGGTDEGLICLWDLREDDVFHQDQDSYDLGVQKGIRKPSYVTWSTSHEKNGPNEQDHASSVSQVFLRIFVIHLLLKLSYYYFE